MLGDDLRKYSSFSRTERMGLAGLGAVIVLLLLLKVSMSYWVTKKPPEPARLIAARNTLVAPAPDTAVPLPEHQDHVNNAPAVLPEQVNINTADSATLVLLKGVGPVTAANILRRRQQKGPFKNINELREVGGFDAETFAVLQRHIVY